MNSFLIDSPALNYHSLSWRILSWHLSASYCLHVQDKDKIASLFAAKTINCFSLPEISVRKKDCLNVNLQLSKRVYPIYLIWSLPLKLWFILIFFFIFYDAWTLKTWTPASLWFFYLRGQEQAESFMEIQYSYILGLS